MILVATEPRESAVAIVLLVLVTPVVVWWIVGDVSEVSGPSADYLFRPPSVSAATETSLGVASHLCAVVSTAMLWRAHRRRPFGRRRVIAVGCLLLVGAIAGYGYRVLTAGVSGANIGGGLIILLGPVIIAGLLIAAIILGVREGKPPVMKTW